MINLYICETSREQQDLIFGGLTNKLLLSILEGKKLWCIGGFERRERVEQSQENLFAVSLFLFLSLSRAHTHTHTHTHKVAIMNFLIEFVVLIVFSL